MSQGLPNIIRLRALCGLLSIDHMVENIWKFCHLPYHNPLMTQSVFSPEMFLPRYSKYPTTEDHRLAMDGKILLFLSALLGFICFNIDEQDPYMGSTVFHSCFQLKVFISLKFCRIARFCKQCNSWICNLYILYICYITFIHVFRSYTFTKLIM